MTKTEMNLDLGDDMRLSVKVPQDMNILQFKSVADKIVKIAKIVEREVGIVGEIKTGNGKRPYNGGKPRKPTKRSGSGKLMLGAMSKTRPIYVKDLADKLGQDVDVVTSRLFYYKRTGKVKNKGNNMWVRK